MFESLFVKFCSTLPVFRLVCCHSLRGNLGGTLHRVLIREVLKVKEGVVKEIGEVNSFFWTADEAPSQQVPAVGGQWGGARWDLYHFLLLNADHQLLEGGTGKRCLAK